MYVIVVGGGEVGYHLTKTLVEEGHEVLLVEKDKRTAEFLADELGEIVVHGDGCEFRTMNEAGMARADVVTAVTGDDEDNLVICQMAKRKFGVPRTIARVNNPSNEELFKKLGIDQTVSATRVIFNMVEQQIETSQVIPLAALRRGNIEIVEIDLEAESPVIGERIGNIDLPADTLIISVVREDHAHIPHADTKLRADDTVIALVKSDVERELRSVFDSPTPTGGI